MAEPKDGIAVAQVPVAVPAGVPVIGPYRWIICGRVFFAATVNYIDRKLIGLLRPILQTELHWNGIDYSYIVFAFQRAYAGGLLIVGRVMDWLGTRKGFSLAVFLWSVAAMAHALAHSLFGFGAARSLGLGESGSFPASIKTVAESSATNLWTGVLLVSLAAAAHQGWSVKIFNAASDMFPRRAVRSVVGLGGMGGAVGGMPIAKIVGYILQGTGSYRPVFISLGSAYLVVLAVIHILAPKLEPFR